MKTTIWYTGVDGGDGSVGVDFYESAECIEKLEEAYPEYYRSEGGSSFTVEGEVTGIRVNTMEDVLKQIGEMEEDDGD